jgi:hypothetical protein
MILHSATTKIEFLAFALAKLSFDRAVSYELSHHAELIANGAVVVLDEGRPATALPPLLDGRDGDVQNSGYLPRRKQTIQRRRR